MRLAGRAPGDWMGREVAAELQMEGERVHTVFRVPGARNVHNSPCASSTKDGAWC